MFEPRDEIVDSDELERQKSIRAILFGRPPTTFLEKKAAAIVRHQRIDFLFAALILKNLDAVVELYGGEEVRLYEQPVKQAIRRYVDAGIKDGPSLEVGDVLLLPRKPPLLTLRPEPLRPLGHTVETEELREGNLADFERLAFGGRVAFQLYPGTSFAAYLYQNLLHALGDIGDPESVRDNADWRARLLLLLHDTGHNEYVAVNAFYANRLSLNGRVYDTSFVPKYDVRSLRPIVELRTQSADEQAMINYYYTVELEGLTVVPDRFIGIFLTFPFKRGYYVQPSGRVVYPNIAPFKLKSTQLTIDRVCDTADIEEALDETARTVELDEVIGYTLYADTLLKQGVALLVLRRMTGNSALIGGYNVILPTESDVLSWTRVSCRRHRVVLPPYYRSRTSDRSLALVQDIAGLCVSEMGATIVCSAYRIPEIDMRYVHANLRNDAERYVFYTILLQEYASPAIREARKALRPHFGRNVNATLEYYTKSARRYTDSTVSDRLATLTEPIVRPTDMRADLNECPPYNCPELYRFADPQLAELARRGDVELTREQLASFIALCVAQ